MTPDGQQPIQDVTPPRDTLGNPEEFANVPVRQAPVPTVAANPIAGAAQPPPLKPQHPIKKDDIDKVLKDVNKEVKAASQTPHQPTKPIIQIAVAVFVALVLAGAAYVAFK